jgi:hypothetical protein
VNTAMQLSDYMLSSVKRNDMNPLFTDYAAHCCRALRGGFTQVPFTWFVRFLREERQHETA